MGWLWISALGVLVLLNVVASARLFASQALSARQRVLQLLLVWFVPLVGAVLCLALVTTDTLHEPYGVDRTAFANNADATGTPGDAPPGSGICGCSSSASNGAGSGDGD